MSLKAFHLFFISVCTVFSFGFSYWCLKQSDKYLTLGLLMLIGGIILACYGIWVAKEFEKLEQQDDV